MKEGQKITFDIYGNRIEGEFIGQAGEVITIKVISDTLGISQKGDIDQINEDFLIKGLV